MPAHRLPLNLEDVPPHLKLRKAAGYRFQSENLVDLLVTLQATPFQMEQITHTSPASPTLSLGRGDAGLQR